MLIFRFISWMCQTFHLLLHWAMTLERKWSRNEREALIQVKQSVICLDVLKWDVVIVVQT